MNPRVRPIILAVVALATSFVLPGRFVRPARAADAPARVPVTSEKVEQAIAKAKAFIYSQQKNGNWEREPKRNEKAKGQEVTGGQWGGQTALAVLALLAAGESPQDARLAPAVEFLMKADIVGTYALGIRCQVLLLLPETPQTKALMNRDVTKLVGMMKRKPPARGFYDYVAGPGNSYSLSRSQYAVLGVWAASQAGQDVDPAYWRDVEAAWVKSQEADGAWRYQPGKPHPPATAGITAVGVATLFIVQDQLYGNRGVDCRNTNELPAIEKGIDWLVKHIDRVAPEQKIEREYPNANLYAVERVGVAGGLKYFGKYDWYKYGADFLLRKQRKDGSWGGGLSIFSDTCFGVLFLSRGRAPVVFNKLDWAGDDDKEAAGNWNRRPRDIANLTRWIGRTSERDLNWQIVNLQAPLADWHDAPILYLSGSEPMKIGDAHKAKMRQYVDGGGMILLHADCGKSAFVGSARKLASEMFPGYEFRELPHNHPIYTTLYPREKWKNKPSVLGVSNGVRELMLLVPEADPAKAWQIGVTRGREDAWQLGANIVFYAADQRDLRFKGETHLVAEDPAAKTSASIKVARLSYKGNWDPEPGGWRRLAALMRRDDKLDVGVERVELGAGALDGFKLAHLTGTTKYKLDAAAKDQLKRFIAAGGTLVVDAAGGSEAFASSVEPDLAALGTGAKLEPLQPDHSLFGGKSGLKVAYRPHASRVLTGKMNVPRLKAVRVGDRPAILFSREDMTAGLVGQSVGGIVGYAPATATELMRRIVLRAAGMTMPEPPSTQPAKPKGKGKKKAPKTPTFEVPPVDAPKTPTADKTPPAGTEGTGIE